MALKESPISYSCRADLDPEFNFVGYRISTRIEFIDLKILYVKVALTGKKNSETWNRNHLV